MGEGHPDLDRSLRVRGRRGERGTGSGCGGIACFQHQIPSDVAFPLVGTLLSDPDRVDRAGSFGILQKQLEDRRRRGRRRAGIILHLPRILRNNRADAASRLHGAVHDAFHGEDLYG